MTPREANADLLAEITALRDRVASLTHQNAELQGALAQASHREGATSEILRVISSSPTDVQPVFDTIAESTVRLCDGLFSAVFTFDGTLINFVAHNLNWTSEGQEAFRRGYPRIPSRDTQVAQAILERTVVEVRDLMNDPGVSTSSLDLARALGYRSNLVVPMLRDGSPIGVIGVARVEAGSFSAKQIDLLKTFADQAVIAIENVRLFTELQEKNRALTQAHAQVSEALEQQTATSEILRVISSSPTDIQPVLDAIAQSAARLCEASDALIRRVDGDIMRVVAHLGSVPIVESAVAQPISRGSVGGRAILECRTVHIHDVLNPDVGKEYPTGLWTLFTDVPYRTLLVVPLVREDTAIGTIAIRRPEVRPFTDRQVALLQTFAAQAVIAVENLRLFTELEERNRDLTEALGQQTATAEILKAISRSTFDLDPVLETLIENATRLCEATKGFIFKFDGQGARLAVSYGATPEYADGIRHAGPIRPGRETLVGRTLAERRTVHIPDALADPEYRWAHRGGVRTMLGVPMLREGTLIGVIGIWREEVRPFTDKQIELVTTFADQAVIAIENVRLFTELQARTQELTRSVGQLTALGEVSRAVSSTLDLETVLTTIVSRAVELSGLDGGVVFEYDAATEEFEQRASTGQEALAEARRRVHIRKGDGVVGRTAITHEPVQVPDITLEGAYASPLRGSLVESGVRALLAVPMLREGYLIGSLVVARNAPGAFPRETVDLLSTFATQSALAIQNARLFREIADKSRQLEVASQHKSEFLANMSHELRTPLNAIIGFSEVLSERMFGDLNEKQAEYLKDIYASGTHLLSLINDILDLSKIEAGRIELELTDFDLPTAIDNALVLVRERAGSRGIALEHSVDERLGEIRGDERKVKQVLLNLLSNALKFTPEGGRVEVRAGMVDGMAEISVTDTGVGIAPADQEAVFEEFRQVGTSAAKQEGTGLGLALCRKFVELHGGKISVQSEVGRGSTFMFTIPVRRGE